MTLSSMQMQSGKRCLSKLASKQHMAKKSPFYRC